MRGLSANFIDSLKNGILQPVLDRVIMDDTLRLFIRNGYINIYYRGSNLLKITEQPKKYEMYFDKKYDLSLNHEVFGLLNLPKKVSTLQDVRRWVDSFPFLKQLIDFWLFNNPKPEREFQQLVERENNRSTISNETEYFVTDIEFADSGLGARFDITAIQWLASDRKTLKNCKPVFIEMKYGDNALSGSAGMIKHIKDINSFISNRFGYQSMLNIMETQFIQLNELGLIQFNHSTNLNISAFKLDPGTKPEFIFLLANHNPRSDKLKSVLSDPGFLSFINPNIFDLRFSVSSFAGYGLHSNNIVPLNDFLKLL